MKHNLILDLKKELRFQDEYFETKINYLLGYTLKLTKISEKSILDFHLAHKQIQISDLNLMKVLIK
jgi:hypothetical protein